MRRQWENHRVSAMVTSFIASDDTVPWQLKAACTNVDPEIFFPGDDGPNGYREARNVCAHCPVTTQCLQFAIDTNANFGMFGGLTPRERGFTRSGGRMTEVITGGHGVMAGTTAGYYRERAAGLVPCRECTDAYNKQAADRRNRRKARVPA